MAGCAVVLVGWSAWLSMVPAETSFQKDARELREALCPLGSTSSTNSLEVQRTSWSVTAAWQYDLPTDWRSYKAWVIDRSPGRFRVRREGGARLELREARDADVLHLTLEPVPGTTRRVRVTLTGEPW